MVEMIKKALKGNKLVYEIVECVESEWHRARS